jgi:hypothetical protein
VLQVYKVQVPGLEHERAGRQKKTRDLPYFNPLAIVLMEIEGMETKSNKHHQAKGSTHISLDRQGLTTREEKEWNPYSFVQLIMERAKVGR